MESLCRVRLNWSHFRQNIKRIAREGKTLMPVVKADAYGHGAIRAARELSSLGIKWLATGTVQEGAAIREDGFRGHIVALLGLNFDKESLSLAYAKGLTPLIHSWEGLHFAASAPVEYGGGPMNIALKVDTGMGRLGFPPSSMEGVSTFLAENRALVPQVLVSHFSVADDPDEDAYTRRQAEAFFRAADILHRRFPTMRCSLGHTAGLLCYPELAGDICRPGIALYGYNPLFGTTREEAGKGFLPVMEVSAPLLSVHPLHAGESLGYGRAYVAPEERMVGWVGIGYADGYRRNPSPNTCMCVNGVRVPVLGRVAMQMTCVDLTSLLAGGKLPVKAGDEVYALGGPGDAVTAQDLALWWTTIPYEVTCLLGKNTKI